LTDLKTQLQATLGSTYTIERELGGGGMSRVFLAEDRSKISSGASAWHRRGRT
jgi:serine/threonine-protein kinase